MKVKSIKKTIKKTKIRITLSAKEAELVKLILGRITDVKLEYFLDEEGLPSDEIISLTDKLYKCLPDLKFAS